MNLNNIPGEYEIKELLTKSSYAGKCTESANVKGTKHISRAR
jgi:hypothetical protein